MKTLIAILLAFGIHSRAAHAQDDAPDAKQKPRVGPPAFRLDADESTATVTAMRFSPDGQTLYVAGWNKVVQV